MVTGLTGFAPSPTDVARDWARSGVLPLTGHRNGPPLLPPGRAASWAALMADHLGRATAGTANLARVDGAQLLAERAALTGGRRRGRVSVGGSCRLLPTADGWAAVSLARADDPPLWSALIAQELDDRLPDRVAAWLASHTGDELDARTELLGLAGAAVRQVAATPPRLGLPRSVGGALVVDFSALWAGPLCAHLLGLAGAEVVKVETPDRPDGARRGSPLFFDLLHAGHHSVVLDPADRAGRTALHALVRRADIVIEASRPRALAGFGLDAAAEVARGCTWVSITAAGRACARVGFGDDVAAAAGLVAHDGTAPVFCGDAIADPLTGLTAAALASCEPDTPGGVLWELSMQDIASATIAYDGAPEARVERRSGGWAVNTGDARLPVAAPVARQPRGAAATMGADTASVLRRLGIAAP